MHRSHTLGHDGTCQQPWGDKVAGTGLTVAVPYMFRAATTPGGSRLQWSARRREELTPLRAALLARSSRHVDMMRAAAEERMGRTLAISTSWRP